MNDCYPDNPCTNYPDAFGDWCPRCIDGPRATVCVVTYGDNAYTDEFCAVYVTLEAARIGLGVEVWETITAGKDAEFLWYEGEAREWYDKDTNDPWFTARKFRAKIADVQIPVKETT